MSRPRRCRIALFHGVHTDPKTIELASCLDIGTAQAVGHLAALWLEIMAHNTKGDIPFNSPEVVERWAQWQGEPGVLHKRMTECGWIKKVENGSAFASGWWECNGSFLRAAGSKLAYKRKLSDSPSVHVPIRVPRPNQELNTSVNPSLQAKADALAAMQSGEVELRRQLREAQEKDQARELGYQRKLDDEKARIESHARSSIGEEFQRKVAQLRAQIESAQREAADLKRKLEQGSQQTQGEALELGWSRCCAPPFPST